VSTPKGPTFAALPVEKAETSAAAPQILQPSGWPMPKGYANGVAAEGRIVVTGGVVGWNVSLGAGQRGEQQLPRERRNPDDAVPSQCRDCLSRANAR